MRLFHRIQDWYYGGYFLLRLTLSGKAQPSAAYWQKLLDGNNPLIPAICYAKLGRALRMAGKLVEAEQAIHRGLNRYPCDRSLLIEQAKASEAGKKWHAAVSVWEAIIRSDGEKTTENVFEHLIKAHAKLGEFEKAQDYLEQGQRRFPNAESLIMQTLQPLERQFCDTNDIHPIAFRQFGYRTQGEGQCIDALMIDSKPRFGNSIIQLKNVLNLAVALSIPVVVLPEYWYLKERFTTRNGIAVINCKKGLSEELSGKTVLSGDFFHRKHFVNKIVHEPLPLHSFLDRTSFLMAFDESLGDKDLVMHVRSGDVFIEGQAVHSGYGQPPLSYYEKILCSRQWKSVSIVYEDDRNPVILPLIELARKHVGDVFPISGTLKSDITYLLRAQVLVASSGTFLPGISELSTNLKKVYGFNNTFEHSDAQIEFINVEDVPGHYVQAVMNNNWENSEEQRALMLTYPASNLAYSQVISN